MAPIRFKSQIRYWNPEKASGLAVVDVPAAHVAAIGGLKQLRVRGTIEAAPFVSNVMPAGGGRLALSVSKAMMTSAKLGVGDLASLEITAVGRDAQPAPSLARVQAWRWGFPVGEQALVLLGARVLHTVSYVAGIKALALRSTAYFVALGACLVILSRLVQRTPRARSSPSFAEGDFCPFPSRLVSE